MYFFIYLSLQTGDLVALKRVHLKKPADGIPNSALRYQYEFKSHSLFIVSNSQGNQGTSRKWRKSSCKLLHFWVELVAIENHE